MKTIKYIEILRENWIRISDKQERAILDYWGKNIGNEFTETRCMGTNEKNHE